MFISCEIIEHMFVIIVIKVTEIVSFRFQY